MAQQIDLDEINAKIQLMKKTAEELKRIGEEFPAIARNTVRILASVKMLEINVSDLVELA
jgi:phosphate uptake regulator